MLALDPHNPPRSPWPPERFVVLSGKRIHYYVRGSGPALILIHGLLGYSFSWRRNLEPLARQFRVYALDLPGLGYSERWQSPTTFLSAVELLREFAGAVGEDRVLLAGHSYGGAAALVAAARFPTLVLGLALLAPLNPLAPGAGWRARLAASPLGDPILRLAQRYSRPLARWLLRHRLLGDPSRLEEEAVEGYLERLQDPACVGVVRQMLAAWDREVVRAALPLIRQPVLILWGGRDRVVPLSSGRRLARALDARLEVLPHCGHLVQEEAAAEVNRLLLEFFGRFAATEAPLERGP